MLCKNCGNEVAEGLAFCTNCGAQMEAPKAEEVVETPVEVIDLQPAKDPGKVLGIVSLILGIAGFLLGTVLTCGCGCLGGTLPLVICIVGLVLGIMGMNKSKAAGYKNTMALIGMIFSIVGIAAFAIICLINMIVGGISGGMSAIANSDSYY